MEQIIQQIEDAFDALNLEYKTNQLQKRDEVLAEQTMLRNRWRRDNDFSNM